MVHSVENTGCFLRYSITNIISPLDYKKLYNDFVSVFYGISPIIDFIQFVYYARKFYLHRKTEKKKSNYSISTRKPILTVNTFEFFLK